MKSHPYASGFLSHVTSAISFLALASVAPAADAPRGPFQPEWSSLARYEVPAWFRDGKFGIFIHWGPETLRNNGTFGQKSTLAERAAVFKGDRFNAADWADLFKSAGATYVVQVGEHHDTYAMYNSSHTDLSAVKMLPKRDFVRELSVAMRQRGLVFGLSSHTEEAYWFDHDPPLRIPPAPKPGVAPGPQPDAKFLDEWYARLVEMVDQYRPQVMWFDWSIEQPGFEPYLRKFAAYYYNRAAEWQQGVVMNYKYEAMPPGTAVLDVSSLTARFSWKPEAAQPRPWQFDSMSNYEWFWRPNIKLRPVAELIAELVDIVSKNGNLLLNLTPDPDGAFNADQVHVLREIGRWLAVNGESVYGTRPWKVFGEGPHEGLGPNFKMPRPVYAGADIRFTAKAGVVYATALGLPSDGRLSIRALGTAAAQQPGTIKSVALLGAHGAVEWKQNADALAVTLPARQPADYSPVLKITFR